MNLCKVFSMNSCKIFTGNMNLCKVVNMNWKPWCTFYVKVINFGIYSSPWTESSCGIHVYTCMGDMTFATGFSHQRERI